MTLRIGDLIETPPVQTVIRLDEGRTQSEAITASFVFTTEVSDHLTALAYALERDTGQGYFLQGDFGSGKSHFLAALVAWFGRAPGSKALTESNPGLASLAGTGRRFLPVDISLVKYRSSTSLESIITGAIAEALRRQPADGGRPRQTQAEAAERERHEVFAHALESVHRAGYAGTVLIIDELSEFFRSKPDAAQLNEDARTLQLLGELAMSAPLWIIAAVQESIERTGDIAQATFRKIKDRFPVRLHLSTLHIRDLISRRLVKRKPEADEHIFRIYQEYRQHFPQFSCEYEFFRSIYPVHPTTLKLLEGLGELFSQHRGIVDFVHSRIAGDPGRAIEGILNRPANELLAPDSIYDHFAARLAEFSAFHVYPRHIVPHLEEVIDATLSESEDRRLVRRLVRILVLYNIHPAAQTPSVRVLAELCACMIGSHNPADNVQFVAGALLDPVVHASRFLSKRPAPSGDPLDAVYVVTTREDHGKTLSARLERIAAEMRLDDSRILIDPLSELPSSVSWPGPELWQGTVERTITWRNTTRRVLVSLVLPGAEKAQQGRMEPPLTAGAADMAVALVVGAAPFACRHAAVWRIPSPGPDASVLVEYFAARQVAAELRPSNPADAPLLPLIKDTLRRLEPLVRQELLTLIYSGRFDGPGTNVEPAARQLRRFDRLLEIAAESVLEDRYPSFKEIASRSFPPSARLYQRMLAEYVVPGSMSLREAREKGLTEALETLAAPLGLAEVRNGAYRLAPNPAEHQFLAYALGLLRPTGPTMLDEVMLKMRTGPYGVVRETAEFLLICLAHCGMITLLNHNRSVPLDYLLVSSLEKVDAAAPGEIIGQADRAYLQSSCGFLAPASGWSTFGLRQQREAWQVAVKQKTSLEAALSEIARKLESIGDYSAFDAFDFDALRGRLDKVKALFDEVKISYAAREGLERFLAAWREKGLAAEDIEQVRRIHRFLTKHVESFIFVTHYLRHRSVENAAQASPEVARRRDGVAVFLGDPEVLVVGDEGVQLQAAFDLFREVYAQFYSEGHAQYHAANARPEVPKQAQRVLTLLRKLHGIEVLDRPPGLAQLLRSLDAPEKPACRRTIAEQLLRSPVCACGFQAGDAPEAPAIVNPEQEIGGLFEEYGRILGNASILEAVTARAYARKDVDPAAAKRLEDFCALVRGGGAASSLFDILDDRTITEIRQALAGSAQLHRRGLTSLAAHLAGRRLTRARILEVVRHWLDGIDEEAIISIEDAATGSPGSSGGAAWWPLLRPDVFSSKQVLLPPDDVRAMEKAVEDLFPADNVRPRLARLDTPRLIGFITEEPFHTRAVQAAWSLLAERVLARGVDPTTLTATSRHLVPTEAAAIAARLDSLSKLSVQLRGPLPERLRARLSFSALLADPWMTPEIGAGIETAIGDLAKSAVDWLETLSPAGPVDMSGSPVVVVVDAVAPDVWLDIAPSIRTTGSGAAQTWHRLTSSPQTVPAMNALFGFGADRDPMDEFKVHGITYYQFSGNEPHALRDLIPASDLAGPLVIRLGALDTAVHDAATRLHELPSALRVLLARRLPELLDLCTAGHRRLVVTTDHGLSLYRRRLIHGKGGVFEEAILRMEWRPAP